MSPENKKYIIYILKYLGVALIAGSVVHVGTLHNGTTRYIILGIIGLLFMVIGHILEARQGGERINFRYLLIVTGLSLATGFFSGGIQHYLDNPVYAGYLLAIGLLCSYIIFFLRDKIRLTARGVILVLIISILILVMSPLIPVGPASDHHAPTVGLQDEAVYTTASSTSVHVDLPGTTVHNH